MSTVSAAHRRTLTTAAAAAGLLFALWFVPSANATPDAGTAEELRAAQAAAEEAAQDAARHDPGTIAQPRVQEEGGLDSTVYVVGGSVVAGAGGVLVLRRAVRGRRA